MPTPLFSIEQSDDGKVLTIVDSTVWANPANTGVTNVTISMVWNNNGTNSSSVKVYNHNYTGTINQTSLVYNVTSSQFTGGTDAFIDGFYVFSYNLTSGGIGYTNDITILLDWASKKYTYDAYMAAPYKLKDSLYFNKDVERCALNDVLLTGMQYNAAVNQTLRSNDILQLIQRVSSIPTSQNVL